jgi:alkylhydroperoxidase family enzyme
VGRTNGVGERQLLELASYTESDAFDELERLVLDYASELTKTPCHVPDALFQALRGHFGEAELVELTAVISWENQRARFNSAFHIQSDGFSEGAVCALPVRAAESRVESA